MLNDLAIACLVFALIMLPQWCFRTKYQDELERMEAEGKEPTTIDFTAEEIREIKKMQMDYEAR